jgi:hypothetical protein
METPSASGTVNAQPTAVQRGPAMLCCAYCCPKSGARDAV